MNTLVGQLFELQSRLWEGMGQAQAFLAIHGLIYPDAMLRNPVYYQFVVVPSTTSLPRRPELDPVPNYHMFPATAVENPANGPAPYPTGANPDVFIGPPPSNSALPVASRLALQTWSQITRGSRDAANYDLDVDRGLQFPCWATQGLISSDPVGIQTLPYEDL